MSQLVVSDQSFIFCLIIGSIEGESQLAQEGTYVYQVKVIDVWGKQHEKVGHVHLVR